MNVEYNERLLNIKETADILGVKPQSLYNWVYARKIEHIKVGRLVRFSREIIDEFIKANTIEKEN